MASEGVEHRQRLWLADTLDQRCSEIVSRWQRQVEANVTTAGPLSPTQLRNAIPDYLHCLSGSLRGGSKPLSEEGEQSWMTIAREHALARVRLGFDVDQLVQEFILLRRVIVEVLGERHGDGQLSSSQVQRITELIEAAISSAVRTYVEARDFEARQKEAEHISFVTHELRNPLSAVKLAAARARRCQGADQQRAFEVLDRNVDRIVALTDGVLRIERLQSGRVEPERRELTLGQLLAGPLENAQMSAQAKGLTVEASYDADLRLMADQELAASAVANVLDNAVKYTDSGSIRVVADATPDLVSLHVTDNCPGLSAQELSVIFEPFERAHARKPGSGLGLAIARRALEIQGGSIDADSRGERGCHFRLTLPRS